MTDPLVTADWLARQIGRSDVSVVDASLRMVGEATTGRQDYDDGHIPGAVFFDIEALSDSASHLPHMLPAPEVFARAAGALGLRRDATIVVYDSQGIFSAPRVWWTLRIMGFPKVFVLDGGLIAWRAQGGRVERTPATYPSTLLESVFDPDLVRDIDAVRDLLERREAQLVDARSRSRFRGEAPEPRAGLRAGHMPGACNLPWQDLMRPDTTMKSAAELRDVFKAAGVDVAAPIVTTCGSGVTAAILALALARLGRADVPVYDGSWTEWGGRADTAVATGA